MKKRKFALERPKEYQENTYIGTLGELQRAVQEEEQVGMEADLQENIPPKPQSQEVLRKNIDSTPQHRSIPVTGKRVLPRIGRKGTRKVDPMHIAIRSEKKPVPSKKEKHKKHGLVWFVVFLLLASTYVLSFEVVKYSFPSAKNTIETIYYPVSKINKHITILPTIQKSTLTLYKKILGK
ncbi:hypothetical protein [Candidatus Uabimicrobium amorphum]|uniref:Uncharacterized protein n=1 Tax=Uabimicrobium amorphum TaxID=2596890 RepID=A0A5S9IHN2_UABAM|nr:hypothetical protein [Candidatus Uabimicrobium amorphum]BBM81953.1 hypothetical protein UABAM_00296 [Candidatus Uabimicrobium amorphum]